MRRAFMQESLVRLKPWLLTTALTFSCGDALADCSSTLPISLPDSNFSLEGETLVTDDSNGLVWMRCSLGQEWNTTDKRCVGMPSGMSWTQALRAADSAEHGGLSDWRLPNRKELATLVEFGCSAPATNTAVFPGTLSNRYWTSTPFPGSEPLAAWFVDFSDGSHGNNTINGEYQVRLVRGGAE